MMPSITDTIVESLYWKEVADAEHAQYATDLDTAATVFDVIIVGAGYTGLNAAIEIARSGRTVAVIDAGDIGDGASGRNAGHVGPGLGRNSPADLVARYGAEIGERLSQWQAGSARAVFERIAQFGIECEARTGGHLNLVRNHKRLDKLTSIAKEWQHYGANVEWLDAERACELSGKSVEPCGGWIYRDGGFLNPWRYVQGLARVAEASGAQIYCQNRVVETRYAEGLWSVATETGSARAQTLLIATNGAPPQTGFDLHKRGFSIQCGMVASAPISASGFTNWDGPWSWPDDPLVFSGMVDGNARMTTSVLIGRDTKDAASTALVATRNFIRYFPETPAPVWDRYWTGNFLLTGDGLPRLTQLGENCFAGFGYNGFGITGATLMGLELAKLALAMKRELIHPLIKASRSPAWALMPFLTRNVLLPLARRMA